ncbi:MAG: hypothetical protein WD604_12315 [Balneolaceae bacterium]
MIGTILEDNSLTPFLASTCSENGISANIINGIENVDYIILKPDQFYNSLGIYPTPPSTDCLIVIKCDDSFKVVLVELKNINSPSHFNKNNIREKFRTVLNDFMSNKFRNIFYDDYDIELSMYFVCDPYGSKGGSTRTSSLLSEIFINLRPLEFANKKYIIRAVNPDLTVAGC